MTSPLYREFDYYLEHQNEIVRQYNGKYVVIKNCEIVGAFDDELEAIETTQIEHELGTFLVQYVSPGEDAYTQRFHSRVSFS